MNKIKIKLLNVRDGKKIASVKLIRAFYGLDLNKSKNFIDNLPTLKDKTIIIDKKMLSAFEECFIIEIDNKIVENLKGMIIEQIVEGETILAENLLKVLNTYLADINKV